MKKTLILLFLMISALLFADNAGTIISSGSASLEVYIDIEEKTSAGWVIAGDSQMGDITEYEDISSTFADKTDIAITTDYPATVDFSVTTYAGVRTNSATPITVSITATPLQNTAKDEAIDYTIAYNGGSAAKVNLTTAYAGATLTSDDNSVTSGLRQVWKPLVIAVAKDDINKASAQKYTATVTMTISGS